MTSRHTVHDIIEPTTAAELLHARANLSAYRAERAADATAKTTATAATTDPNTANQVSTESLEHAARVRVATSRLFSFQTGQSYRRRPERHSRRAPQRQSNVRAVRQQEGNGRRRAPRRRDLRR